MKGQRLRLLLIINPISGTQSKKGLNRIIERHVTAMGHSLVTHITSKPGDATAMARQAVIDGFDAVLVCGGDGTVNEAASGLIGTDVALGILPCGSGNGLARHIDIPIDPIRALDIIRKGHISDCDYCTVNGHPFFCTFGIGFDAAVSRRFASGHRRGLIAYLKSAVDEFLSFTPEKYSISIDSNTLDVDAFLIACCNASQYGNNAYIAPTASITDGMLDVTVIHSGNPLTQAFVGVELLAGSIASNRLIDTFRTRSLHIVRPAAGITHIDGEPVELPAELSIECHRGGLKIFAPVKKTHFKPILTPVTMFLRDMWIRASQPFVHSH